MRPWAAARCSIACWDIFAGWSQLKHSWPAFTGLSVLKAYLRWKGGAERWMKKKSEGERESEHREGKKKLTSARGRFKGTSAPAWSVCCHLIPELIFCLSFGLPVPLFHSQETGGHMYTRPLAAGSPFSLPLWANKMLFVSSPTSCIVDTQCAVP